MKNIYTQLTFLLMAMFINISAYSQPEIKILRVEFKLDSNTAATTVTQPGMYKDAAQYEVIFHVDVSKTKGIFGVEISMGTTEDGNEYLLYSINTDVQNFSQNVYILPRKKEIVIDAGKYELLPGRYFAKARLRYSDGTYGPWKKTDAPSPRTN